MKKLNLLTIFIMLVFASVSFGQSRITGSAHDFTTSGGFNQGGEICIACHTPHNADILTSNVPLWNHAVTTASFTMYTSATFQATAEADPAASSKMCLSCHDGTVALDSYGGVTGSTTITSPIGTQLMDDHPISFTYDDALEIADGELKDSGSDPVLGMLFGGQMECASCHDVHNGGSGTTSLLVIDNAGSALCLTCHDK